MSRITNMNRHKSQLSYGDDDYAIVRKQNKPQNPTLETNKNSPLNCRGIWRQMSYRGDYGQDLLTKFIPRQPLFHIEEKQRVDKEIANRAAIIIQRAFRAKRRRKTPNRSNFYTPISNVQVEANIDRFILQAAGLSIVNGPSQRHIKNRRVGYIKESTGMLKRSASVRVNSRYPDKSNLVFPQKYSSQQSLEYMPPPFNSDVLHINHKTSFTLPKPPPRSASFLSTFPRKSSATSFREQKSKTDKPAPVISPSIIPSSRKNTCDSSSSSSSIDSGHCSMLTSPTNQTSQLWIRTPTEKDIPSMANPNEQIFEPRPLPALPMINKSQISGLYESMSGDNTYSSIYGRTNSTPARTPLYYDDDIIRKRYYRVGLNLFNQCPQRGMEYLLKKNFLEFSPTAAAKFVLRRKGISKKMLGEYLCQLHRPFNLAVLHCFIHEIDFSGLHIDIALRQLQYEMTLPKESHKIEKVIEVFAKRYVECNNMFVSGFNSADTIFVLSYAMILLNTDLHAHSVGKLKRMTREAFIRNLKGVDCGKDIDEEMLGGIYDRIKANVFKTGMDHVTQVAIVEQTIKSATNNKKISLRNFPPNLVQEHRRLVCFCRVTEVINMNKSEKHKNVRHQRGLFLFNDLLIVTKSIKQQHKFRYCLNLRNVRICVFSSNYYAYGIQLQDKINGKFIATYNARSEADQNRFVTDIQESIWETIEMENARIFINDSIFKAETSNC